jgi:hypothetical protein
MKMMEIKGLIQEYGIIKCDKDTGNDEKLPFPRVGSLMFILKMKRPNQLPSRCVGRYGRVELSSKMVVGSEL